MLVVCVYVCLDEQMLTGKKRRQVAGTSRQLFFACWHTNHEKKNIFFKKKVAHFTLIYIGYWRLGSHRPVCDSLHPDSLQLQQGLFELFRQFVCTDTSGDGERKEDRKKKNKPPPCFTLALFLLHSSITVTRHYNHANIAPQSCRKSVRLMQYGHGLYKRGFFYKALKKKHLNSLLRDETRLS